MALDRKTRRQTGDLMQRYPAIVDLQQRARRRLPRIAWEYLDMGTGDEMGLIRNRNGLHQVTMPPRVCKGPQNQDVSTILFGQIMQAPFGCAPVGLSGLIWPNAEQILARSATSYGFPYCLSTVATQTPETIGPIVGDLGWFQLYPPREARIRDGLLDRARDCGFKVLVVSADVSAPSRRERTLRAGLAMPPKITASFVLQALLHPSWTAATLRRGLPRLRVVEGYADASSIGKVSEFVGKNLGGTLSWQYLSEVRDAWHGPLVLKGLLHPADAEQALAIGVDGVVVSNHGARQFDGGPAAIDALPAIAEQVKGRAAVVFDSGLRSGLDVIRALTLGADFVLLGRAFLYGVAALGAQGGDHVAEILLAELKTNMAQLGVESIGQVKQLLESQDGVVHKIGGAFSSQG